MNLINATPHNIFIYDEIDVFQDVYKRKLIVKPEAQPKFTIASNGILNAKIENVTCLDKKGQPLFVDGIPFKKQQFLGVDNPYNIFNKSIEDRYQTTFIVSNLYRAAVVELFSKGSLDFPFPLMATVGDVVYSDSENPRPVGCLTLII